ncbi:restriction endonuclease subunit S [Mangrovimonas spongiae]|uniref:Restriction endonuclease subunit S n=1 Tax=Mangrovimonas spongiae TaxID=2494697 RepID=A0A428K4Y5_9FLAO|nr:restriction endonuclease subunit S [Mangrovimonas spongiae]RSK41330.1 restriction endonuclease subunit S [Mangrovimonas spongiae]
MNKEKQKIVPQLRFPEFQNDEVWKETTLNDVADYENGKAHEQEISEIGKYKVVNSKFISTDGEVVKYSDSANLKANLGDILMVLSDVPNGRAIAKCFYVDEEDTYTVNQRICKITPTDIDNLFLFYIQNRNKYFLAFDDGVKQTNLRKDTVLSFPFFKPENHKEQQKIANCLSSLDNVITAETEKLELLQDHKKGLLQQLFPAKGETKPQYRFPEFKNDGDWEETTLENCLDYLQPTPYLVSSTDYDDKFETPVLTAGKTFVLGYTDEKEGIFNENLPVIIFDDFTTATKFVDFPFKAKSSAMKILLSKGDNNIKFLFETIQNLKFEVSTHKRHWISVYSKLNILKPKDPKEQQKIADCFSSADDLIQAQKIKIQNLKNHKKGLLQQLFPNSL